MSGKVILRTITKFVLLNLGIITALTALFCPSCFMSREGIISIYPEFIMSFILSCALSMGGFAVEHFFDQRISWIEQPIKRLLLTFGVYLAYSFLISFFVVTSYVLLTVDAVNLQNISWGRMIDNTAMPVTVAIVIISIFISRGWLLEWRNTAIQAEQLKSQQLESQNQSLIDQLNPHFLFNSLNVLTHLVYENADKSAAFIQQLSQIYRYLLDVQQEQLVNLERELEFAESYLQLQKIRFGDSLHYSLPTIEDEGYFLPPLSLQLLLENAIKHNVVSEQHPLTISIRIEGKKLVVSNNLQPKTNPEDRSGRIGLANIVSRYGFLSKEVPIVRRSATEFRVELPLLSLDS